MKVSQEHYEVLESTLSPLDKPERQQAYKEAGLSPRRYRWDLLWTAQAQWRKLGEELPLKYYNDEHIDTALRKITKTKKDSWK